MLELYFFNIGHGDSIAVKFPDGSWGLIDCCCNLSVREPNVLIFLRHLNIKQLEFICVTHPHEDHYDGMDIIVSHFQNNIKQYIIYGLTGNDKEKKDTSPLGRSIKMFCEFHNFKDLKMQERLQKLHCIKRNEIFYIDNVKITCLNPSEEILDSLRLSGCLAFNSNYNAASVVLLMEYAGRKILFNGDSVVSNWREILKSCGDFRADISKISHHGSKENNSEKVLNASNINNSTAVISSDSNIKYKSVPSKEVIDYLKTKLNSCVLQTNSLNNTEIISDVKMQDIYEKAAINIASNDKKAVLPVYDGLIKISISSEGRIEKQIFNTIREYFNYIDAGLTR